MPHSNRSFDARPRRNCRILDYDARQKCGKQSLDEGGERIPKPAKRLSALFVEDSSSLSGTFRYLFFIEQSQASADDFRHRIYDGAQNLVGDNFVGMCRQATF